MANSAAFGFPKYDGVRLGFLQMESVSWWHERRSLAIITGPPRFRQSQLRFRIRYLSKVRIYYDNIPKLC